MLVISKKCLVPFLAGAVRPCWMSLTKSSKSNRINLTILTDFSYNYCQYWTTQSFHHFFLSRRCYTWSYINIVILALLQHMIMHTFLSITWSWWHIWFSNTKGPDTSNWTHARWMLFCRHLPQEVKPMEQLPQYRALHVFIWQAYH